jgi:hypothetical protein
MQYPRAVVTAPAQAPLDIEQAAKIATDHQLGAGFRDRRALPVDDGGRQGAELDGEGATKAAALLRRFRFDQLQTRHPRQ